MRLAVIAIMHVTGKTVGGPLQRVVPLPFALSALLVGALWAVIAAQSPQAQTPEPESVSRVIVFPFENITGAESDQWIGVGLGETLRSEFAAGEFEVVAEEFLSNASMAVEASGAGGDTVVALARRARAAWMVSGGYQLVGDRIRITAQLVEVATGLVAWSVKVDGVVADLFTLQDRIAAELLDGPSSDVIGATARPPPGMPTPTDSAQPLAATPDAPP